MGFETGIYLRVSTEEQAQEGFSIRAQEQKLKDFARIKDWAIYKIYADEGISGKDITGRPAVKEMIADVEAGHIKNVLVFKIDRLTRSTADLIYLVDLFNQHDCAFNSLMESIDTQTASGRMFIKIIGIFAEFERENIMERTRVGVERKVKEGFSLCTATPSYGFDRPVGQKIQTINEDEASVVREIFDLYVNEGATLTDVARRLNLRGVATKREKNWDSTKIRRVLKNVNYIGSVRHHVNDHKRSMAYDGLHEGFIPQELFDQAQVLLGQNEVATPRRPPREENYFAGFLVCGLCGYRLKTYNTQKQLKTRVQYTGGYVCGNRTLKTCNCGSMSHKKVEAAFEEYISQYADFDVDIDTLQLQQEETARNNASAIAALAQKRKSLESKERETMQRYVADELTFGEYREFKQQIETDMLVVHTELDRLQKTAGGADERQHEIAINLRQNWAGLSHAQRRLFLRSFVEKIVIVSKRDEGEHFGTVRVEGVGFLG